MVGVTLLFKNIWDKFSKYYQNNNEPTPEYFKSKFQPLLTDMGGKCCVKKINNPPPPFKNPFLINKNQEE